MIQVKSNQKSQSIEIILECFYRKIERILIEGDLGVAIIFFKAPFDCKCLDYITCHFWTGIFTLATSQRLCKLLSDCHHWM